MDPFESVLSNFQFDEFSKVICREGIPSVTVPSETERFGLIISKKKHNERILEVVHRLISKAICYNYVSLKDVKKAGTYEVGTFTAFAPETGKSWGEISLEKDSHRGLLFQIAYAVYQISKEGFVLKTLGSTRILETPDVRTYYYFTNRPLASRTQYFALLDVRKAKEGSNSIEKNFKLFYDFALVKDDSIRELDFRRDKPDFERLLVELSSKVTSPSYIDVLPCFTNFKNAPETFRRVVSFQDDRAKWYIYQWLTKFYSDLSILLSDYEKTSSLFLQPESVSFSFDELLSYCRSGNLLVQRELLRRLEYNPKYIEGPKMLDDLFSYPQDVKFDQERMTVWKLWTKDANAKEKILKKRCELLDIFLSWVDSHGREYYEVLRKAKLILSATTYPLFPWELQFLVANGCVNEVLATLKPFDMKAPKPFGMEWKEGDDVEELKTQLRNIPSISNQLSVLQRSDFKTSSDFDEFKKLLNLQVSDKAYSEWVLHYGKPIPEQKRKVSDFVFVVPTFSSKDPVYEDTDPEAFRGLTNETFEGRFKQILGKEIVMPRKTKAPELFSISNGTKFLVPKYSWPRELFSGEVKTVITLVSPNIDFMVEVAKNLPEYIIFGVPSTKRAKREAEKLLIRIAKNKISVPNFFTIDSPSGYPYVEVAFDQDIRAVSHGAPTDTKSVVINTEDPLATFIFWLLPKNLDPFFEPEIQSLVAEKKATYFITSRSLYPIKESDVTGHVFTSLDEFKKVDEIMQYKILFKGSYEDARMIRLRMRIKSATFTKRVRESIMSENAIEAALETSKALNEGEFTSPIINLSQEAIFKLINNPAKAWEACIKRRVSLLNGDDDDLVIRAFSYNVKYGVHFVTVCSKFYQSVKIFTYYSHPYSLGVWRLAISGRGYLQDPTINPSGIVPVLELQHYLNETFENRGLLPRVDVPIAPEFYRKGLSEEERLFDVNFFAALTERKFNFPKLNTLQCISSTTLPQGTCNIVFFGFEVCKDKLINELLKTYNIGQESVKSLFELVRKIIARDFKVSSFEQSKTYTTDFFGLKISAKTGYRILDDELRVTTVILKFTEGVKEYQSEIAISLVPIKNEIHPCGVPFLYCDVPILTQPLFEGCEVLGGIKIGNCTYQGEIVGNLFE